MAAREDDVKVIKGRRYLYRNGAWVTGQRVKGQDRPPPTSKTYWTNDAGTQMWVVDSNSIPPARNLQTGEFASRIPSTVGKQFTPRGPYTQESAQLFPYASQHIEGFPSARGTRKPYTVPTTPAPLRPGRTTPIAPVASTPEPSGFREPKISDPVYDILSETTGEVIGKDTAQFNEDYQAYLDYGAGIGGVGGVGPSGPSSAELAMARERLESDKLASYMDSIIAGVSADIDAKRLTTEQAMGEFTRRLDALSEAGTQYKSMAQYAVPEGTTYRPGFEPGGVATKVGLEPRAATPIRFDPFKTAVDLIESTPNLAEVGAPSTLPGWNEALALARQFAGLG